MKTRLDRNVSSEDEIVDAYKPKTRTLPTGLPNLRKFGMHRTDQLAENSSQIDKFLEYFNLISIYEPKSLSSGPATTRTPALQVATDQLSDLDPQKSLVDQILNLNSGIIDEAPIVKTVETKSKIEQYLEQPNQFEQTGREFFKYGASQSTISKPSSAKSPLYKHLAELGCKLVPGDSFEHIKNLHESTKTVRLELVYGNNEFWPVKVKRCQSSRFYQLKLVNSEQHNGASTTAASSVSQTSPVPPSNANESTNLARNKWSFHKLRGVTNLKPLGWAKENNLNAKKPPENADLVSLLVINTSGEIDSNLEESCFKETKFLDEESSCELFDDETRTFRQATVKRNVNGRLLLEICENSATRWVSSSDPRLRPLGDTKNDIKPILHTSTLRSGENGTHRSFLECGSYLECLYGSRFHVGKVIESIQFPEHMVRVEIDSNDEKIHSKVITVYGAPPNNSFYTLFPCNWCLSNNLRLGSPHGWPPDRRFDWAEFEANLRSSSLPPNAFYLTQPGDAYSPLFNWSRLINQQTADKFALGAYLECVDPTSNGEIVCLARIRARLEHLLFLELPHQQQQQLHVFSADSLDLFPLGWSEMNNFYGERQEMYSKYLCPSRAPLYLANSCLPSPFSPLCKTKPQHWCGRIFLNTRVNCGPYFDKSKLEQLPRCVGPGPLVLVLQKLIQMLINQSEKPFKLLKLFQETRHIMSRSKSSTCGLFLNKSDLFHRTRIKAKDKGKMQFRDIEVCSQASQLQEFLNEICVRLKCCPRMISTSEPGSGAQPTENDIDLCLEIQCCLICSLNYFYKPNIWGEGAFQVEVNSFDGKPKLPVAKNIRLRPKLIVPKLSLPKPMKKSLSMAPSPVKTRLNLRLAHSIIKMSPISKEKKKLEVKNRKRLSISPSAERDSSQKRQQQSVSKIRAVSGQRDGYSQPGERSSEFLVASDHQRAGSQVGNSLNGNPMNWGSREVCKYLLENKFDPHLVYLIEEHEIDGQAFLMLNLPTIQSYMNLKLGPALKLAHLVEKLKIDYFQYFPTTSN